MYRIICFLNHNRQTGKTATVRNLAAATTLLGCPALMISAEGEDSGLWEDGDFPGLFYMNTRHLSDGGDSSYAYAKSVLERVRRRLPPETLFFWDTPSSLSSQTRTALCFAQGVFIPMRMEAQAFDRLGPSLGLLEWTRKRQNAPLPLLGLIPVRVQPDQRFSQIFAGSARGLFRTKMVPVPVPEDPCVRRSEMLKKTVFSEDFLSPSALAFRMLAQWLQEILP